MLLLQNISYIHPNKELLFSNLHLTVNARDKVALIGNNGVGKSTLLKIIAGELAPSTGTISLQSKPYYLPQIVGQYNHLTIAQALGIADKLHALNEILAGNTAEEHFNALNDDWTIEERCREAMTWWQLNDLSLTQTLATLSGGQKTKVFLAGLSIHQPELILLDEPSNHLDLAGRSLLYDYIDASAATMLIVSHDRKLLQLMSTTCELTPQEIAVYGGNYDFYSERKQIEKEALQQDIHSKEKALRKAKEKERETIERQQKLDARGKGKQEKEGVARIMMKTLRNNAENSTAKMKSVHHEKIDGIAQELKDLRSWLPGIDTMSFGFDQSSLHKGKILFKADNINYSYSQPPAASPSGQHSPSTLWPHPLTFQLTSGERIALTGANGSGKTTLIKIILGALQPTTGAVYHAQNRTVYIDQEYSLLDNQLNVYEQAQQFNTTHLEEHEIKIRLNRFLFTKDDWDKSCHALSGGQRMRLMLCCLTIGHQSPDIIILDEPTNNLDIQNINIPTAAINKYQCTLIVVSHDSTFIQQINPERTIALS